MAGLTEEAAVPTGATTAAVLLAKMGATTAVEATTGAATVATEVTTGAALEETTTTAAALEVTTGAALETTTGAALETTGAALDEMTTTEAALEETTGTLVTGTKLETGLVRVQGQLVIVKRVAWEGNNVSNREIRSEIGRKPYLSDGVGLLSVGDLGRAWAVGGILVNDLSGVGDRAVVIGGGTSDERGGEGH